MTRRARFEHLSAQQVKTIHKDFAHLTPGSLEWAAGILDTADRYGVSSDLIAKIATGEL
jgi:hypothetical protein